MRYVTQLSLSGIPGMLIRRGPDGPGLRNGFDRTGRRMLLARGPAGGA